MSFKRILSLSFFAFAVSSSYAAGFALYEGSAYGIAMGGAVMGRAVDASANFYNPATLTDMTGTVVTVGATMVHPTCDTYIDGHSGRKMDPGRFTLPNIYLAQELPYDFSLGLGLAAEYGLGTHYKQDWPLAWDSRQTTIEGVVFNPNLAYKVTDKWSVSAGFRLLYASFEQYSDQMAASDGARYGTVRDHLNANNSWNDWGWQLSTKYDITEKLSAGVMYRSYIDTKIKGYNHTRVRSYDDSAIGPQVSKGVRAALAQAGVPEGSPVYQQYYQQYYRQAYSRAVAQAHSQVDEGAAEANGDVSAAMRLPQSLTFGLNYDATEKLHLGTAAVWTQWSSVDHIYFDLPGDHDRDLILKWNDAWRMGFGAAYDLTDDWTFMISYAYDMDPCRKYYGTTILPPGDRHLGSIGLAYTWGDVDFVLSYGLVFLASESLHVTDATGVKHKFETSNGLSHSVGLSMTYHF